MIKIWMETQAYESGGGGGGGGGGGTAQKI
jgi:hypothetical protein